MKNHPLLFPMLFLLFIACEFSSVPENDDNSEGSGSVFLSVVTSVEADATYLQITVTADDLDDSDPVISDELKDVEINVPSGKNRVFSVERFDSDDNLLDSGTVTCTIDPGENEISVTLNIAFPHPEITGHPENREVEDGDDVTFSVTAEGFDVKYQWQVDGKNVKGASSEEYVLESVTTDDDGKKYRCIVSNAAGSDTSKAAECTVSAEQKPDTIPPEITAHPKDKDIETGDDVTFSITADGSDLTYQWQVDEKNVKGATSDEYVLESVTSDDDGKKYRCIVSNAAGSDTSKTAELTVSAIQKPDTTPPVIAILEGDTVEILLNDPEDMLSYYREAFEVSDNTENTVTISEPDDDVIPDKAGGPYTITYSATDSAGNTATAVRYVFITVPPKVDIEKPILTISDTLLNLPFGCDFSLPKYAAFDLFDGNITDSVEISGTVDCSTPGEYILTYSVSDIAGNTASETCRVIVEEEIPLPDEEAPVITLLGDDTIQIPSDTDFDDFKNSYTDPGYTASDNLDGDITDKITVSDFIKISEEYWRISYNVTDSSGNAAETVHRFFDNGYIDPAEKPEINLVFPDSIIELVIGNPWVEPGYTASDEEDGDITDLVEVDSSNLIDNIATPGSYTIIYRVVNSRGYTGQKTRAVRVVSNPIDIKKPVITLLGKNPDSVLYKSSAEYADPGATALDNFDGDLTDAISVTGSVNMNSFGKYTVTYRVTDNAGWTGNAVRTVVVVKDTSTNDLLLAYGVPTEEQLPAMGLHSFTKVDIDGEGPENMITSIRLLRINWRYELEQGVLREVSFQYEGPPYYRDVTAGVTQSFEDPYPEMTITGTHVEGLDGEYYVSYDGTDFVWVEKTGKFAIIWSP